MRILVAIDDNQATQPIIDALMGTGWSDGTQMLLTTVVSEGKVARAEKEQLASVQQELEAVASELKAVLSHCEIAAIVKEGDPREEIIALATEMRADLVLMGTNNRAVGSVSQAVLNAAPCPVLIAKNERDDLQDVQTGFRTVLVPFDNSAYSQTSLAWLLQFKWLQNASFILLTIVDSQPQSADDEAMAVIQETLNIAAQQLQSGLHSARVATRIAFGKPSETILEAAQELQADLLVMGSHGHTGIQKMILGSVSSEVSRRVSCSVLVVRGLVKKDRAWQRTGVMTLPKIKHEAEEQPSFRRNNDRNESPHVFPGGMH